MKQKFTPDHLVRYIYKETSSWESAAIEAELHENAELREEYKTLVQGYRQLPKVQFKPSRKLIKRVLTYSETTALETQY